MRRTVQSKVPDPSLIGLDPEQELFDATPEETHDANLTAMLAAFKAKRSASPQAPSASGRESASPEQSTTGVVDRVMKAHGLTRAEAEEEIRLFGG